MAMLNNQRVYIYIYSSIHRWLDPVVLCYDVPFAKSYVAKKQSGDISQVNAK